jgi:uncharacterized protein YigE (DUF2233 family)
MMGLFLASISAGLCSAANAEERSVCRAVAYADVDYVVCSAQSDKTQLSMRLRDQNGAVFGGLGTVRDAVVASGKELVFAMNGGMYHDGGAPVGLYIESGTQETKLSTRGGAGNFHLKPNGVFFIRKNKAGVMETARFAKSGIKPDFATQSGPMLVVGGKIHPKFDPASTSRKYRNGVGVDRDGVAHFVISDDVVTFYAFAQFFRDHLGTQDALYLDGTISSLLSTELERHDRFWPVGPVIVGVKTKARE